MCLTTNQIFAENPNQYFIETGSYLGDGINFALQAGFQNIISIEIADKYYSHCSNRFANEPKVQVIKGDSAIILWDIIKTIDAPITFWLDGHCSGGDTGQGIAYCPLLHELAHIEKHPIKTHTILIDDVRCWQDFNPVHGLTIEDCIAKLKLINPAYQISYADGFVKDDVLVCKP